MEKYIDIDKLFEEYFKAYMKANKGKFTEEEWEGKVVELYDEFAKLPLKELGGLTADTYYADKRNRLVDILKGHIQNNVAVSDALITELIHYGNEQELANLIDENNTEALIAYAINILNDKQSKIAVNELIDLLLSKKVSSDIKEIAVDYLSRFVDDNIDLLLKKAVNAEDDYYFTYLLASANVKTEKITRYLVLKLHENYDRIPEYVGYIVKYGDESALSELLAVIEREDISYLDYKELKLAIEAFGGSYEKERDFSSDKYFKRLKDDKASAK